MSTRRIHCRFLMVIAGAALVLAAPAIADEPLVYATIQPAQITLGESAKFTITNLGDSTAPITMPVVSGLQFEIVGRTRQVEIINGTTLPSSSIVVRVTPQMAGIFTIPGVTPKSQPLVLQVNSLPGSAGAPRPSGARAPSPPPILAGGSIPKGVHLTDDGSAYVRLSVPKREVYVGESIPFEIEVGMRSGFVTRFGLPRLTGDIFTLNSSLLREPERSETMIDGQAFVLLTWRNDLLVVKPGTFPLSAEVPLTVKIRTRPRRESALDDQFGDPFWQNFFGASVPKDINVESPPQEVKVLELPAEGRPADFHGAVGTFAIESDISPVKAEVGEPLTLRMRVVGSGNFDRVDSSMLDHVEHWKTYPPKSTFNSNNPLGHKGEKVFEQPVIASKPGVQTLPALSFSYFDPNTKRYETAHSPPLSVTISPSLADSTQMAPSPGAGAGSGPVDKLAEGLKADHAASQSGMSSLIPPYLQPRFLLLPSLIALAFAGGWVGARRRKLPAERFAARNRIARRATKRALAQMESAARSGDSAEFFNSARTALQQSLAARWQLAPDEV
ncbi:MAG TPA: BatD family protein, partial [Steroidobacteraceae bacterium]|nr:BatD family protein [Steroidobacteraceae bacterium]